MDPNLFAALKAGPLMGGSSLSSAVPAMGGMVAGQPWAPQPGMKPNAADWFAQNHPDQMGMRTGGVSGGQVSPTQPMTPTGPMGSRLGSLYGPNAEPWGRFGPMRTGGVAATPMQATSGAAYTPGTTLGGMATSLSPSQYLSSQNSGVTGGMPSQGASSYVQMRAPDGSTRSVPAHEMDHWARLGAVRY